MRFDPSPESRPIKTGPRRPRIHTCLLRGVLGMGWVWAGRGGVGLRGTDLRPPIHSTLWSHFNGRPSFCHSKRELKGHMKAKPPQ